MSLDEATARIALENEYLIQLAISVLAMIEYAESEENLMFFTRLTSVMETRFLVLIFITKTLFAVFTFIVFKNRRNKRGIRF